MLIVLGCNPIPIFLRVSPTELKGAYLAVHLHWIALPVFCTLTSHLFVIQFIDLLANDNFSVQFLHC